MQIWTER